MTGSAKKKGNTRQRVQTAVVIVPFLLYALFKDTTKWMFPAETAIVASFAAIELAAMVAPGQRKYAAYQWLASAAVFLGVIGVLPHAWLAPGLVLLIVGGMLFNLAIPEPVEGAALRIGYAVTGPLYVGGLFGLIGDVFQQPYGGAWILLAMVCSFFSDTGGYFAGRAFGKHKLAPRVSPKKTIEGSVGGLLAAVAGSVVVQIWFLPAVALPAVMLLAAVAAFAGQLGDLCESLIKRGTGVKDSGNVLPGHGGMLDRSDALLFATAVIWAYVHYLL